MLDETVQLLDRNKRIDLVQRLNKKSHETSLGAEAELAIAWSLRHYDLELEPEWWTPPRLPDLYIKGLVQAPLAIEITAFSDKAIAGEDVMDACSQSLIKIANGHRKNSGEYLYFYFGETRIFERGINIRNIAAPKQYTPSDSTAIRLAEWIDSEPSETERLHIEESGLIVQISKLPCKQTRYYNYWVSRPPRIYSHTRNPLMRRLIDKAKQLKDSPIGVWRTIFIVEAGSSYLSEIRKPSSRLGSDNYARPEQVIEKFIDDNLKKIDAVVVFIPTNEIVRHFSPKSHSSSSWKTIVFARNESVKEEISVAADNIRSILPFPRFDGSNAKSLIRQNAMRPDSRGWYLGTFWEMKGSRATLRFSARAFQDYLARRIDEETFRRRIDDDGKDSNIGHMLENGFTIQDVRIESGGIDEDDDFLVLEFEEDASASPFK